MLVYQFHWQQITDAAVPHVSNTLYCLWWSYVNNTRLLIPQTCMYIISHGCVHTKLPPMCASYNCITITHKLNLLTISSTPNIYVHVSYMLKFTLSIYVMQQNHGLKMQFNITPLCEACHLWAPAWWFCGVGIRIWNPPILLQLTIYDQCEYTGHKWLHNVCYFIYTLSRGFIFQLFFMQILVKKISEFQHRSLQFWNPQILNPGGAPNVTY